MCTQVRAIPVRGKPSVEAMRAAGEYADLAELWLHVDTTVGELDYSDRSPAAARKVHDALMLLLCFREHPITRPSCMRQLLVPGAVLTACNVCASPACPGNHWQGATAVFTHYKTARSNGDFRLTVQAGSKTAEVLAQYLAWARPLLLKDQAAATLFLTTAGRSFITEGCWNEYLPRLLSSCAKLTWTRVRPPAARLLPACAPA